MSAPATIRPALDVRASETFCNQVDRDRNSEGVDRHVPDDVRASETPALTSTATGTATSSAKATSTATERATEDVVASPVKPEAALKRLQAALRRQRFDPRVMSVLAKRLYVP